MMQKTTRAPVTTGYRLLGVGWVKEETENNTGSCNYTILIVRGRVGKGGYRKQHEVL